MASVLVFCSSGQHISPMFFSEMELLAKALVDNGHKVIYGGAQVGLMGHLADQVLSRGGHITGVIPSYLNYEGMVHPKLSDLHVVSGLMDRKQKMLSLADVAIAFPGGIGTLDEVSEVLALRQLGESKVPLLFHNFLDFWDPLIECFTLMQQQKMVSTVFSDLFQVFDNSDEVISFLNKFN